MARKRKTLQSLDYNSQEYWNKLLVEEGLAVEVGRHPKLILVGGSTELEIIEKMEKARQEHRCTPKGTPPDSDI